MKADKIASKSSTPVIAHTIGRLFRRWMAEVEVSEGREGRIQAAILHNFFKRVPTEPSKSSTPVIIHTLGGLFRRWMAEAEVAEGGPGYGQRYGRTISFLFKGYRPNPAKVRDTFTSGSKGKLVTTWQDRRFQSRRKRGEKS